MDTRNPRPHSATRLLGHPASSLLLLLLVAPALAATDPPLDDDANRFGPDTVLLKELENEYEPVPFSHRAHAEMAEMWDGCVTCHHKPPTPAKPGEAQEPAPTPPPAEPHGQDEADTIPACKSCHTIEADEHDIRVPSLKGAYHRQCLNCHREWTGENNCNVCHAPKNGQRKTAPTPGDIVGRMHPPIQSPTTVSYKARYTPVAGGNVLFRHEEHIKLYGLRCVHCHQRDNCSDCHSDPSGQAHHPQKPVKPAMTWEDSHRPCLTCHQEQSCNHCHFANDATPPQPFNHALATGQAFDDDHADLTCVQCHRTFDFTVEPTCGNGACHGEKVVKHPADRPGPFAGKPAEPVLPHAEPLPNARPRTLASLRPRPLKPTVMNPLLAPSHQVAPRADQPTARPLLDGQRTKPPMPEPGDPSCVTDDCHVSVKSYAVAHGPVGVNACDVCHRLVDEDEHTFEFVRQSREMCTYCHEFRGADMPVVHEPVKLNECLGCHNPHGGPTRALVRESSTAQMCGRCHESVVTGMTVLHTPVRDGLCTDCHSPHGSRLGKLLDVVGTDMCVTCHESFGQQLAQSPFTHRALDEQCERCHGAHGATHPLSLKAPVPTLCYECHEETKNAVAAAAVTHHGAVLEQASCLNCHTAHGSDLAALMRDLPINACMQCHDKELKTADDRTVAAVTEVLDEQIHRHGPIREGQCSGCHTPHGGPHASLLTAAHDHQLYAPFSVERYAFCFQCHDAKLAMQPGTEQEPVTGFRNGQLNLHMLHVNDKWGRSCEACHESHASPSPMLVKPSLLIKKWRSPMGYRKTETGGYCAPGCHRPFEYDRVNPVELLAQANRPAPATARVELDPSRRVSAAATDTAGRPVRIPAEGDRLTLVAAVRFDPGENVIKTMEPLAAALPEDPAKAQVVVVVTGPAAPAHAQQITEVHGKLGWRVVVDSGDELTKALDIRAWPSLLLIARDPERDAGREVARIRGNTVSLAMRLHGYLDALGDGKRPNTADPQVHTVTAEPNRGVQYLQLAQRLRDNDEPAQAEKVLAEALKLHPEDGALKLAMAQTLVDLSRAREALDLLEALPAPPAGEARTHVPALLRARALVALGRHDEARAIATALLNDNPRLREAHFLMGQIYEHADDWRNAAESYRRASQP